MAGLVIRDDNILVVEKRDKRVMLFAAENYDLEPLVRKINEQNGKGVENWLLVINNNN